MLSSVNKQQMISEHFLSNEYLKTKKNIATCFTDILKKMCFNNNNDIIIDYRYFKFIALSDNHNLLINYIILVMQNVLKQYSNFCIHINLESFTLLHIEKYFSFIKQISETFKTTFPDKLDTCYMYNAPFIFSKLFGIICIFIDKPTQQKIKLVEN
jgi:hypothetical protein